MRGRVTLLVILGLLCGRLSTAAPIGFTDRAAYDAATTGFSGLNTLNFESLPTGVMGLGPIQGITFAFNIGVFNPSVVDRPATTSATHSLGTTGDGIFLAGDSFTMTFAPSKALGLYVIAADIINAGDFTLAVPGGNQSTLGVADSAFPLGLSDRGKVFFLGLVDPVTAFTTATFSSVGFPADFVFNIDDITGQIGAAPTPTGAPVPEPASLVLLGTGIAAVARRQFKQRG